MSSSGNLPLPARPLVQVVLLPWGLLLERLLTPRICRLANDTVTTLQARAARKLALPTPEEMAIQYLWCDVYYTLEDGESCCFIYTLDIFSSTAW